MTTIAVTMFVILALIAAMHVVWAFGVRWPAQHERDLAAIVIGATGQTRMPGMLQCLIAAAAIFAAGIVALAVADLVKIPGAAPLVTMAGIVATVVFAGRGLAAYLPAWRRRFAQEPFATMDRSWYGPLCLLLAVAFAMLVIARMGS